MNSKINVKTICFGLLFLTILLSFFVSNKYYLPSEIILKTFSNNIADAKLYWDSGMGFNDRESENFTPFIEKAFENKSHKVEIVRTGDSNQEAIGNEVWIKKIQFDKNRMLDLKKITIPEKTFINTNNKLALKNVGNSVEFYENFTKLDITFFTHKWAGKVNVIVDGKSNIIDLYSQQAKDEEFSFCEGAVPGSIENKFSLPQLKIKAIKIEFTNNSPKVDSMKIMCNNNEIVLHPSNNTSPLTYIYSDIPLNNSSFNLTLFLVQFILTLLIISLLYEVWNYIERLDISNIASLLKYIFLQKKHLCFWVMFLVSSGIFFLWLLGQWPGVMTVDSYHFTWREIKTLKFLDVTPWIYNIYVLSLTQFYDSPAVVAFFQVMVTSLLGSYIFYYAYKNGANLCIVIICFIFFIFSIPVGIFNITMWKDVPYALVMVFWGFLIFDLYYKKKYFGYKSQINFLKILLLSILFILMITLRYNGMIYLLLLPIILYSLLNRKNYYQFIFVSLIIFVIITAIKPISVVDQKNALNILSATYKIAPLAAIYTSQNYYSPSYEEDKKYINKWASDDELKNNYNPVGQVDQIGYLLGKWTSLPPDDQSYLNKLYYRRTIQNFNIFFADRSEMFLGAMGFAPNIFITTNELINSSDKSFWRPKETYRFTYSPKIKILNKIENYILKKSMSFNNEIPLSMIIFNTFPYMIIFIIVLVLYKYFPAVALYSFFFLFNLPFLFVLLSTCEWRYFYFLQLSLYFIFPLLSIEYGIRRSVIKHSVEVKG